MPQECVFFREACKYSKLESRKVSCFDKEKQIWFDMQCCANGLSETTLFSQKWKRRNNFFSPYRAVHTARVS